MSNRMTEDQVQSEFRSTLGRNATQAEVDNWTRYGSPGQISYELAPGRTTKNKDGSSTFENENLIITHDKKGKETSRAYKKGNKDLGSWLDHSLGNGKIVWFSNEALKSTSLTGNLDKHDTKKGWTPIVKNTKSGGLAGLLGIDEILNDWVPDEVKALTQPIVDTFTLGGTSLVFGEEYDSQAREEAADMWNVGVDKYSTFENAIAGAATTAIAGPLAGAARGLVSGLSAWERHDTVTGLDVAANVVLGLVPAPVGIIGRGLYQGLVKDQDWSDVAADTGIGLVSLGIGQQYGDLYGTIAETGLDYAYYRDEERAAVRAAAGLTQIAANEYASNKSHQNKPGYSPTSGITRNYPQKFKNDIKDTASPSYYKNLWGNRSTWNPASRQVTPNKRN